MRSVFLAAQYLSDGSGGICRVARLSALALRDLGITVSALSMHDADRSRDLAIPIKDAKGSRARFVWFCARAATHTSHYLYDFPGSARTHSAVRIRRRPYSVWIHGYEVWGIGGQRSDYAAAVKKAGLVLVNSDTTLERAERVLGRIPQAKVCWLATESDEDPPVVSRPTGGHTVMFLGRSDSLFAKGQDILIEVWPQIVSAVPGAVLVFVGGGDNLDHLKGLSAASPAAASIRVLGFQSQEQVDRHFSQANVFVLLSHVEGFGLVFVEAMRHGIPILASTEDASCETNVDGETGFNVSRSDRKAIVDRLVLMLRDEALSKRMGQAGRRRWREHFSYSSFRSRFGKIVGPWLVA